MSLINYTEKYIQESSAIVADNAARQRLSALFDNGEFTELDRFAKNVDKPCEAVTAYGTVNGVAVYAFSQDSTVCAGAMGAAQANKLERLYALAEKNGCPVVGIFDSAGGYIDDGVATLTAYGKLIGYATRLSGVVPQISVIAGACTGAALLLAQMADVTVALKDNENVKSAVAADDDISAVKAAALLLSYFPQNNLAEPLWSQQQPSGIVCEDAKSAVESIADAGSVLKLFDDECECAEVYLARIGGLPAGIVSAVADEDICEAGALKIAKLVSVCDAFSLPVVTLLDAKGFSSAKAAAILAQAYSQATSPKVTVICGNAIGQAFIAMASYGANA
ncbi:MAG: carboxyl transferase, partial [Clostridia bacterium]|nr:carboxyl transferase [Clostridia bacterium]